MKRLAALDAIELVRPALASSDVVPIFTCLCFQAGTVYAYNDQLGIRAPIPELKAEFAVNGDALTGLLKNSKAKDLEFDLQDDGNLLMKLGGSRGNLPFKTPDEFLFDEPEDKWDAEIKIDVEMLKGLKLCLTTSSVDHSLPALMGVVLKIEGGTIKLYSCNGDATSRYDPKIDGVEGDDTQFTMPNDFCSALMKVFDKALVEGTLQVNDEWAKATFGEYSVYGRVIVPPSDSLDHAKLLAEALPDDTPFIEIPKSFDMALSRARVISDKEGGSTHLSLKEGKIKMNTESSMGDIRDAFNVKGDHPDISLGVSAKLIQEAVSVCEEMALMETCTAFRSPSFLQVIGNLGD